MDTNAFTPNQRRTFRMLTDAEFDRLCEYDFTLQNSTHKQDDRMYVQFVVNNDPQSALRMIWQYTTRKPKGREGRDFETVVDADEAFAIVQRRNARLFRTRIAC